MYHFDWPVLLKYIWPPSAFQDPLIRAGLIATIVVSIVPSTRRCAGTFCGFGKMSKFPIFRWVSEVYIWYFRGTPSAGSDGIAIFWFRRFAHLQFS